MFFFDFFHLFTFIYINRFLNTIFLHLFPAKKVSFSDRKNYLGLTLNIPPRPVSPSAFRERIPLRRQRRDTGQQESVFRHERLLFDPFIPVNTSAREILRAHIEDSNARYISKRRNAFAFPPPSPPPPLSPTPPLPPTPPPILYNISEV